MNTIERPPAHFTQDYYTPDQLHEAHQQFSRRPDGVIPNGQTHMWDMIAYEHTRPVTTDSGHSLYVFTADLRPGFISHRTNLGLSEDRKYLAGPGDLTYQANCPRCQWHHIDDAENKVIEAWHDHAVPGWRQLPIIPRHISQQMEMGKWPKKALAWIEQHYPADWQAPGHPVITVRGSRIATRHVEGYSPWGGCDLSHADSAGAIRAGVGAEPPQDTLF